MVISKRKIQVIFMTILMFHINLVSISSAYLSDYFTIKLCMSLVLAFLIFLQIRTFLKKEYLLFNLVLLLFCISMVLSSFFNRNMSGSFMLGGIIYSLGILEAFLVVEYADSTNLQRVLKKTMYYLALFYVVITDVLMFTVGAHLPSGEDTLLVYFIGNKFNVAYLHIMWMVLYYATFYKKKQNQKILMLVHFIVVFAISRSLNSGTSTIACVILLLFFLFRNKIGRIMNNSITYLLSIGIFDTILLIGSAILKIPAISYIIQNLLNKSSDLTGRLDIYTRIFIIMKDSPLWGVGNDNNYAYSLKYALAGNVQNGLFDIIVSFGIIGTVLMFVVLVLAIRKGKKRDNLAFKAYLFVLIVLSMVEVTFRLYSLVLLAMIAFGSEKVNQKSLHQHNLGVLK